eukprot:scaffold386314_cov35-Attheya_sp.AAC.1
MESQDPEELLMHQYKQLGDNWSFCVRFESIGKATPLIDPALLWQVDVVHPSLQKEEDEEEVLDDEGDNGLSFPLIKV